MGKNKEKEMDRKKGQNNKEEARGGLKIKNMQKLNLSGVCIELETGLVFGFIRKK